MEADYPRLLHVVVGHGLRTYFRNAVRSVRAVCPDGHVLVIDNASPDPGLRDDLRRLADGDPLMDVIFRQENDAGANAKVGSLYAAYETAFEYALARGFELLHLVQSDFQVLWWDEELVARAMEIFRSRPRCVNIQLQVFSRDMLLTDETEPAGPGGLIRLRKYGLTDTGLYHLGRWRERAMRFGPTETGHAGRYLAEGLEVILHPWPCDVPIPWPAVVRDGAEHGRQVTAGEPFLIKPLPAERIAWLKGQQGRAWREDLCVPWGWACLTPMWATDLRSIDYWVLRYRDARRNGIRNLLPRPELRGVAPGSWPRVAIQRRYSPSLFELFIACPARHIVQTARSRAGRAGRR
jgi:hypothetical protein